MSDTPYRIMVDIETTGIETGAAIVQIGAASFDRDGIGNTFNRSIDLVDAQQQGLHIDADTLLWWLDQEPMVREQLHGGDDLLAVMEAFAEFCHGVDEIWANSPAFDCKKLKAAGEAVGIEMPWDYWQQRDYRTLMDLPVAVETTHDTNHYAIDDAVAQAKDAAATLRAMEDNDG